jgi:hypothetical protein
VSAAGKAALYRTAVVKGHIFTHNGEQDIAEGTIVAVSFRCMARNQMYKREEPVYSVTLQGGKYWGDLYESALCDFVL